MAWLKVTAPPKSMLPPYTSTSYVLPASAQASIFTAPVPPRESPMMNVPAGVKKPSSVLVRFNVPAAPFSPMVVAAVRGFSMISSAVDGRQVGEIHRIADQRHIPRRRPAEHVMSFAAVARIVISASPVADSPAMVTRSS